MASQLYELQACGPSQLEHEGSGVKERRPIVRPQLVHWYMPAKAAAPGGTGSAMRATFPAALCGKRTARVTRSETSFALAASCRCRLPQRGVATGTVAVWGRRFG